ncbi:MAG TPA: N-acetylmuramoyl-L-alanine amidase [Acidobacteriota bacterium]
MRLPRLALVLTGCSALSFAAAPLDPDSDQLSRLLRIRHWNWPEYTRIVLDFDQIAKFEPHRLSNPDRFYIDLLDTRVERSLHNSEIPIPNGFLTSVRIAQNSQKVVRVVLTTDANSDIKVFPILSPDRVVIDVFGGRGPAASEPGATPNPNGDGTYTLPRQLGLKVGRIVIDAGHGGKDPGTRSAGGLEEKEVVLDVARRVARELERDLPGCEVLLTRSSDRFLSLPERTALANGRGDLFVSIHANSSPNRRARGVETYYLNFATDPEAMRVAARENAVSDKRMADLLPLVQSIVRNSKISESAEFAATVQRHLVAQVQAVDPGSADRGVKRAPFYVLIGAQIPSILVEISFLTHPRDAELVGQPSHRARIAAGIAAGIQDYLQASGTLTAQR